MIASTTDMALEYYRAATEGRRPAFVPSKVRLVRQVCGDGPFRSIQAEPGEHACRANQWGAVSIVARNGQLLGVKPAEFVVLDWCENPN